MIDRQGPVSVRRQCEILRLNRSGFYYEPVSSSEEELGLMRCIDELHLKYPFYGSRMITLTLRSQGSEVNRKRIQRLMRMMGIVSIAPQPKTSTPGPEHTVYPYLLRKVPVTRPNHVWAADITYIPMAHGFVYLVAIMDWCSRRVLSWRISTTMESQFCVDALQEALDKFGEPDIFNTDQGAQFTSDDFTSVLLERGVKVSMDGKGRYLDNIFVERLWRSLKYEEVYLYAYSNVIEAKERIGLYFQFYNNERFHASLGNQTPSIFYEELGQVAAE